MRKEITALVLLVFMLTGISWAADLNWDEKKVKIKDLVLYPNLPDKPEEISKKDFEKALKRLRISHRAMMGGVGGFFLSSVSAVWYEINVNYSTWDQLIKMTYRDINVMMLTEEEAEAAVAKVMEEYPQGEAFYISMHFGEEEWSEEAEIENWNVIMFDQDGNRYSPLSIEEISTDYGYDGDYMYVTSFYVAYFEKLPEEKEKIELVLAGGYHEDKKLGFRWIFE